MCNPTAEITLAVIIGNRDFLPDVLMAEARKVIEAFLDSSGIQTSCTPPPTSPKGQTSDEKLNALGYSASALHFAQLLHYKKKIRWESDFAAFTFGTSIRPSILKTRSL